MKTVNGKRSLFWSSFAFAIAVVAWRVFDREPSIDQVALQIVHESLDGNARSVAQRIPKYELDKLKMSRGQAEKFLDEFVLPKLRGTRIAGESHFEQGGHTSAIVMANFRAPDTRDVVPVAYGVELYDDGPQIQLRQLLQTAWRVEYARTFHPPSTTNLTVESALWGIQHDRATLLKYGFTGFVAPADEEAALTSLDEAVRNLRNARAANVAKS